MTQNMDPKEIGKTKGPTQADPNSPYLKDFNQRNWSELSQKYQSGRLGDAALEAKVAKLAREVPELRKHLVPLLRQAAQNKLAHKPLLVTHGLKKSEVQSGMGFMVYKVDPESNNSKFYEGLIVEDDQGHSMNPQNETGGFRFIRRWGALTDSGQTGRVDGAKFDEDPRFWFPSLQMAKRELNNHYAKRVSHGYIDAFGPKHVTPDGYKLPMGEYPVGLTRAPGFGWGSQSVTNCIPSLREVQDALGQARAEIAGTGRSEVVKDKLDMAIQTLKTVAHADSTMAQKILGYFSKSYRRLSGSPRFLPDPTGQALAAELATAQRYINKQLSLCN